MPFWRKKKMNNISSVRDDDTSIRDAEKPEKLNIYKPLPSFLRRTIKITPIIELMGFLKDHRRHFKEHWIAACSLQKNGGQILKQGLTFMFEMELLIAVLFFGIATTLLFEGVTREMVDKAHDEYLSLEFFILLFGVITLVMSFLFFGFTYITLIILQPIHESNVLSFVRTEPYQIVMAMTNYCLLVSFYSKLFMLVVFLIFHTNLHPLILGVAFFLMITCLSVFLTAANNSMNLALKSGCFSHKVIIDTNDLNNITPQETERILYNRVIDHQEYYGDADILHDPYRFYRGIQDGSISNDKKNMDKNGDNNTKDANENSNSSNNSSGTDGNKNSSGIEPDALIKHGMNVTKRGVFGSIA